MVLAVPPRFKLLGFHISGLGLSDRQKVAALGATMKEPSGLPTALSAPDRSAGMDRYSLASMTVRTQV